METPGLDEVVRTSEVVVHRGRYAYLKALQVGPGDHFLVARDADEVTVVTEERNVASMEHSESTHWFVLTEIRVSMPFVAKGFLAKVTAIMADVDLNVLVVSTYSKDYIMVREEGRATAIVALRQAGFPVSEE
jgi:hypothetical protein